MVEIIKHYKQEIPAMRFVGKKYGEEHRKEDGFGYLWREWFQAERFKDLESLITKEFKSAFEDASAYIGLMRFIEGEAFEYWIGMFVPAGTEVPVGYDYKDFPASKLGVCWLKGKEHELFMREEECANKLTEEGYELIAHETGEWWFFERYDEERFSKPDENGHVILDICHYVK